MAYVRIGPEMGFFLSIFFSKSTSEALAMKTSAHLFTYVTQILVDVFFATALARVIIS